jgi:ornithine cyclodeaminase
MALATVLKPQDVRVHARGREGAEAFIAEIRGHFDAPWRYCETAEQAVRSAGVIVTATRLYHPPMPIVRVAWLEAGSLSLPVDIHGAFEPSVYRHLDKFVCDQWEPLLKMAGADGFPEGPPTLHGELHEVLCGAKAGRTSAGERIMAMNTGMAIEDVVVANAVLAAAERRGLGMQLAL